MGSTTESSDPYLHPGTTILKNLRGLTDPENSQRSKLEVRIDASPS